MQERPRDAQPLFHNKILHCCIFKRYDWSTLSFYSVWKYRNSPIITEFSPSSNFNSNLRRKISLYSLHFFFHLLNLVKTIFLSKIDTMLDRGNSCTVHPKCLTILAIAKQRNERNSCFPKTALRDPSQRRLSRRSEMIGWSFHGFQTSLSKATHYPWVAREGWHTQERAAARYNDDKNICRRPVPRRKILEIHILFFLFPVFPSSFSHLFPSPLIFISLRLLPIFINSNVFERKKIHKWRIIKSSSP